MIVKEILIRDSKWLSTYDITISETLNTKKEHLKKNIRELDGRIENKFEGWY